MKIKFQIIKITVAITALLALLLTNICCSHKSIPFTNQADISAHPYRLDSAIADIDTFRNIALSMAGNAGASAATADSMIIAYTISKKDFATALALDTNACNLASYSSARVYIGYNHTRGFKLYLVPVDTVNGNCKDRFFRIDTTKPNHGRVGTDTTLYWMYVDTSIHASGSNTYVLGLTSPCPSFCDTSSLLMRFLTEDKSCTCSTKTPTNTPTSGAKDSLGHPYRLDSAIVHICTFQAVADTLSKKSGGDASPMITAYTIFSCDIQAALGCAKPLSTIYGEARVYLGYSNRRFELYLVPVDTANANNTCGKDRFFNIDRTKGRNGQLPQDTSLSYMYVDPTVTVANGYVLDLISPCPYTCDTSSLLMHDLNVAKSRCSCNSNSVVK